MKSVQHILTLAVVVWALTGCGQKGALYMPGQPSQPVEVVPPPVLQTPPTPPTTSQ